MRFEGAKVTHVQTQTRRMWQYKDLPERLSESWASLSGPHQSHVADRPDECLMRKLDNQ